MSRRRFRIPVRAPQTYSDTVIDRMVELMTVKQAENPSQGIYSFEIDQATVDAVITDGTGGLASDWWFLGENHDARRVNDRKPAGTSEINDFIGAWGDTGIVPRPPARAGYRAFEGGPAPSNVTLLQGAGGAARCFWDTVGDCMWHIAGSTGSDDIKQGLMKYGADRDEFKHWTAGGDYTEQEITVTNIISPDEFEATNVPEEPTGFYNDFGIT